MKTFPILYKKATTGAIQQWQIAAFDNVIQVIHGQVGGKLQTGTDVIKEGKNIGRSNETTANQQAELEAEAKWTKQLKKGYVKEFELAQEGATDALIEGGLLPMLAPNKSYPKDDDFKKRIVYPCYVQPKLDGMRCIAIIEDGVATVWSRTRKKIPTIPHIVAALEASFPEGRVVLDGELYNHAYKDRFEDLLSILRGDEPDADGEYLAAEFHVYDCPERQARASQHTMEAPFEHRNAVIDKLFDQIYINYVQQSGKYYVRRVDTVKANNEEEAVAYYEARIAEGYEGAMARNAAAPYESGRRSKHLQKMKEFIDQEFKILGANDGRGKDAGTVATFTVSVDGSIEKTCDVRLKATYARRRELWQNPEQWRGKLLTVRFKRWTAYGIPYIPVGQGIRDYE